MSRLAKVKGSKYIIMDRYLSVGRVGGLQKRLLKKLLKFFRHMVENIFLWKIAILER